ncbi:hypothetical protein Vadar_032051 [Vaccinium darrowii]|uniref:Uncharacterized protein n=1 Tax=Vaccinium darrowii TaxID=229202 RepID=A0ACB7X625_9ERIC|nr:hypothetical protein Vadar_032051 [Vaccinium darrowii]
MANPTDFTFSLFYYSFPITVVIATFIPWFVYSLTLQSDIEALRSLKQAVDPSTIPPSSFLETWNFQVDPCENPGEQFLGIVCTISLDNSTARVLEIDLDPIGYDGFLTPAIGDLTELTTLNLNKNKFRGPIPFNLSNLQNLTKLQLSNNFFTGYFPHRIDTLKRLEIIDLSHNELSGSIPRAIANHKTLTVLVLANNNFIGRIPHLTGVWQLNTLDLSRNQFNGNLPQLPVKLRTLVLSNNNLSGHISPLKRFTNLKTMDLSDNKFSGPIYHEILTLPNVNHINLSINSYTEMQVIRISQRDSQLQVLDVHSNHISGHLSPNLATYVNLTTINLSHNQFSGRIPVEYGQMVEETQMSVFLDDNWLVGRLPPQFNSRATIRGSLAQNCLDCPQNIQLCNGGQKPVLRCVGMNTT